MPRRLCNCKKKSHKGKELLTQVGTFERVEWLKKRVDKSRLTDRTVKLKYLVHPAEMNEHIAVKKVFKRFDEDGNSSFL